MPRRAATAARTAAPARRTRSASERSLARTARRSSGPAPARAPRTRAQGAPRLLHAPAARALRARGASLLDALLHGRGWIGLVGVLLVGIVFLNVSLLELNRGIARTDERSAALESANARLRLIDARLGSTERIQRVAEQRGLVLPAPGDIHYLRLRPRVDGRLAARRAIPPGSAGLTASVPSAAPQPLAAATTQAIPPTRATPTTPVAPAAPPTLATAPSGQG
jgi:cell division protein FtsL